MKIKQFCLLFSIFLGSTTLSAQDIIRYDGITTNDVSARIGFEVKKEFPNKIALEWEEELRMKNYITSVDRINSTLALSYSGVNHLKFALGYTFIARWHDGKKSTNYEKYWDLRHRIYADLAGNYKYMRWKFTLRERFLTTFRTDDPNLLEKANPKMLLRSKLSAEYSIFGKPLKPYASFEVSNTLNAPKYAYGNYIDALRTEIGLKWRIDRRNALQFYYRLDVNYDRDIDIDYKKDKETIKAIELTPLRQFNNIIGVVYAFDWR